MYDFVDRYNSSIRSGRSVELEFGRMFLSEVKVSIDVVICCHEVNVIAIQFSIGGVCNILDLFNDIYAIDALPYPNENQIGLSRVSP